MKIIETGRLLLRHLAASDAEFMFELVNEPAWIENIGNRNVKTIEDAERYILDRMVCSYELNGFGLYLVELKETGEPAGICGLVKRDYLQDVDIGFAFLERFRSKGYASESARAVADYASASLGLKRLAAITVPNNIGSIKVLEKIGLRLEKTIKAPDDETELMYFAAEI